MMTSGGEPKDLQVKDLLASLPTGPAEIAQSDALKAAANAAFGQRAFSEAVDLYSQAIAYTPTSAPLHANRALAYNRLELYGAALNDADAAISLDPTYIKGYYRRAVAVMALGRLKDAVKDFRAVVKVAPQDADARKKLAACEKELKKIEFEKAISFDDDQKSALDLIGDFDNMVVEAAYKGPHLDPAGITLDFVKDLLHFLKTESKLHKKYTYQLLRQAKGYFEAQPPLVDIRIPEGSRLTVCGDIHGQYYDLMHIFTENGLPSPINMYLFNGDFVDRGSFSVECILILLCFKLLYPDSLYMTRGNHETISMNKVYGFEGEVKAKYSDLTFKLFTEIFDALPLGHLIMDKILVVHGGLFSRDDVTLDEIRQIDRFRQPPSTGLMCEMLWSDPQPEPGRSPSKRGVGLQFGPDVTAAFCALNGLDCIIRSHEVKQAGYEIEHGGRCITIFSAPNYCDSVGNKGAYIHITPDLKLTYTQFSAVPHPAHIRPMQYASALYNQMM